MNNSRVNITKHPKIAFSELTMARISWTPSRVGGLLITVCPLTLYLSSSGWTATAASASIVSIRVVDTMISSTPENQSNWQFVNTHLLPKTLTCTFQNAESLECQTLKCQKFLLSQKLTSVDFCHFKTCAFRVLSMVKWLCGSHFEILT